MAVTVGISDHRPCLALQTYPARNIEALADAGTLWNIPFDWIYRSTGYTVVCACESAS